MGGHLTNQTILTHRLTGDGERAPGANRGLTMTSQDTPDPTPEMIRERFDLLTAGAIEYALFL
jgi:hypothetical protein